MDALNDDVLIEVLRYLPLHDRLRCESVQRRWMALMPYADVRRWVCLICSRISDRRFALEDVPWSMKHVHEVTLVVGPLRQTQVVVWISYN